MEALRMQLEDASILCDKRFDVRVQVDFLRILNCAFFRANVFDSVFRYNQTTEVAGKNSLLMT